MPGRVEWTPQRVVAAGALLLAVIACGIVVVGASGSARSDAADRLEPVVAPALAATKALSAELDGIAGSRAAAADSARKAATALATARRRTETIDLPVAATPVLTSAQLTLDAAAEWVDAVGSVLANPRSALRGVLAERAAVAARRAARLATFMPAARDAIRGTGHLLSATRRA